MNTTLCELIEITVDIEGVGTNKEYSKQATRAIKVREQIVNNKVQELIVKLSAVFG